MNLELVQEINDLKENNLSYTEIAEITGLARTSVVLSLRLSKIFNTSYSQQISSLKSNIEILNSTIDKYKDSVSKKETEIKILNSLIDIDYKRDMLVNKDKFKNLEDEVVKSKNEVDMLKRKIHYQNVYLKNLSFTEKIKILFNQGD